MSNFGNEEEPVYLMKKFNSNDKERRRNSADIALVNSGKNDVCYEKKSNHKFHKKRHDIIRHKSEHNSHYLSMMLCAVSLGFVILNLPLAIKIIYEINFNEKRKVMDFLNNKNDDITDLTKTGVINAIKYDFFVHISHFLIDLNYIVNFFLYFLSGSKFRSRLFSMICKSKRGNICLTNRKRLLKPQN